VTCEKNNVLI